MSLLFVINESPSPKYQIHSVIGLPKHESGGDVVDTVDKSIKAEESGIHITLDVKFGFGKSNTVNSTESVL